MIISMKRIEIVKALSVEGYFYNHFKEVINI